VQVFGGSRALGITLRVAGLARGGEEGVELLGESVAPLRESPAVLERAGSLRELGAGSCAGVGSAVPRRSRSLRSPPAGRPSARGTEGDRGSSAARMAPRHGGAHAERAARRPPGR